MRGCGVAGGELLLVRVIERQMLGQHEDVFGPIVPGEGGRDLGFGGPAPAVAMPSQHPRVALAGDDVAEDPQAGHAGDVADDERQLHVHLHERLLHALDLRRGALDEGRPVPQIGPQCHDLVRRPEAPPQEPHDVQVAQPLRVRDITLTPRHVLHMPRVDQAHLKAAGLEDFKDRDPIHARGFQRHVRNAAGREPVGEPVEAGGERVEGAHRHRVPIRRHRGDMVRGPAVEPGRVRVEVVERGGRAAGRSGGTTAVTALHGRRASRYIVGASGSRDAANFSQSPKRAHAEHGVSPMMQPQRPRPR